MMSSATISQLNYEAAERASAENRRPFQVWEGDTDKMPPFPFPEFGDFRPDGWTLVQIHFVDSSGMGREWEPALTLRRFLAILKAPQRSGHGYAILSAGQFQVYIGEFVEEDSF